MRNAVKHEKHIEKTFSTVYLVIFHVYPAPVLSLLLSFVLLFHFFTVKNRMCKNKCENKCENNCLILYFHFDFGCWDCRTPRHNSHLIHTPWMQWKVFSKRLLFARFTSLIFVFICMRRKRNVHWFISTACCVANFHIFTLHMHRRIFHWQK